MYLISNQSAPSHLSNQAVVVVAVVVRVVTVSAG